MKLPAKVVFVSCCFIGWDFVVKALRLIPQMRSLAERITTGVRLKFPEPSSTVRVIECFERFNRGEMLDVMLGDGVSDHNRQKANCFVTGLTTETFHNVYGGKFEWAQRLEENAPVIQEELKKFLQKDSNGDEAESSRWLGPRFVGQHYGNFSNFDMNIFSTTNNFEV